MQNNFEIKNFIDILYSFCLIFFNILKDYWHLIILLAIIFLAYEVRLTTSSTKLILDYDPWWFYRHAKVLLENNFVPPKWDYLSYYPPGRPYDFQLGWSYTIAFFYLLFKFFIPNFMDFACRWVAIFAALCTIPAYLVGRVISNKYGALATAFLATTTPTFITVSMYGYVDSDVVVVFYTFLVIGIIFYTIKNYKGIKSKRTWFAISLAVLANWLFAFNWNSSWYVYYLFLISIPAYLIFKIFIYLIQGLAWNETKEKIKKEGKRITLPILIIGVIAGILTQITSGWPFNTYSPIRQLLDGLALLTGRSLIVNISVAELQPVSNLFSSEVLERVGRELTLFSIFGLILLIFYKLFSKSEFEFPEVFVIVFLMASLFLMTKGIRFSLIFSIAVSIAFGYLIGNLYSILNQQRFGKFVKATVFGFILFLIFFHLSKTIKFSYQLIGMEVSQNWVDALNWLKTNADKDALIATWWDPGHIITGFTGLKVHADGAHCGYSSCIPYNHDIRIRDMGRILSSSNESESVELLKKYMQLSEEDCEKAKKAFNELIPTDACKPVSEVYVIASSDLIGKYYWLSCFGSFNLTSRECDGRNFLILSLTGQTQEGLVYQTFVQGFPIKITLTSLNNSIISIFDAPVLRIRNRIVKHLFLYSNGQLQNFTFDNPNAIEGTVFIDPSYTLAIFMDEKIQNSLFTKMFFYDGKDLKHFELVFSNPEVKIFKLKL
jgi:hypothetical protein